MKKEETEEKNDLLLIIICIVLLAVAVLSIGFTITMMLAGSGNVEKAEETAAETAPPVLTAVPSETQPPSVPEVTIPADATEPAVPETMPTEDISDEPETDDHSEEIEELINSMELRDKVYQLFIVSTSKYNAYDYSAAPVGGVIYLADDLTPNQYETQQMIAQAQSNAQSYNSGIGMFICVDEEGGDISRVSNTYGMNSISAAATQTADDAYQNSVYMSTYLEQLGFNVDFAPVADVNIGGMSELVGDNRMFGSDAEDVADKVSSFVQGMQQSGKVSATLKHFPGLGAASDNTHTSLVADINRTLDQLRAEEFIPFSAGIEAGADFVMIGHQMISGAGIDEPADLSETVITDWLRGELGFEGIVITDAQSMNTVSGNYTSGTAAVESIMAGVDIVLEPQSLEEAANAVMNNIDEETINERLRRILQVKYKLGLI